MTARIRTIKQTLKRLADYPHRRFTASRPGSVLILVIALLVLLALIGTAYISTTRVERYTSHQNEANTQIDLLMDGLVNMVEGAVAGDLFDQGSGTYRNPQTMSGSSNSYVNVDSIATKTWLSSRIPDLRDNTAAYNTDITNNGTNPCGWEGISWPLLTSTNQLYQFDLPNQPGNSVPLGKQWSAWSSTTTYNAGDIVTDSGSGSVAFYQSVGAGNTNNPPATTPASWTLLVAPNFPPKARYRYEPTVMSANGTTAPAFYRVDMTNPAAVPAGPFMAADTDHDGIADAMMWKLPVGVLDGVTYYAAYRVVDNNAAINANTAMSLGSDYDATGTQLKAGAALVNPSLFTSNVGLTDLLASSTAGLETTNLNGYRFNSSTVNNMDPSLSTPQYASGGGKPQPGFAFMTQGDSLYHQLGRRVSNPGFNGLGFQMRTFPLTDGLSLGSSFCIENPSNPSLLESSTMLYNSVNNLAGGGVAAATSPYSPAFTQNWFLGNFNYTLTSQQFPLRALLTTINGASNRDGAKLTPSTATLATGLPAGSQAYAITGVINPAMLPYDPPADNGSSYAVGNFIKYQSTPSNTWGVYRCLQSTTTSAQKPDVATRTVPTQFWAVEPWTPTPTKTSINTATFSELFRSFYNLMSDQWNIAPGTTATAASPRVGLAMWKSSIRGSGTVATPAPAALSDIMMVQLRAALASVNAMDLRDTDNDITSRSIYLVDDPSAPVATARVPVKVTVYGSEKQLFITKVLAYTDGNNNVWCAVELYNPYVQTPAPATPSLNPTFYLGAAPGAPAAGEVQIGLGLRLGFINRSGAAGPVLTEIPAPAPATLATVKVPPGGYVVLCTSTTPPAGVTVTPPLTDPTKAVVWPGLEEFFTGGTATGAPAAGPPGELVLLRTREATGTALPKNTPALEPDPEKQYDESVLAQNVPMDQYDMSGVTLPAAGTPAEYYYARPSGPDTAPAVGTPSDYWKCVYPLKPGQPYMRLAGGEAPLASNAPVTFFQAEPTLVGSLVPWHQIQINNVDWPCPSTSNGTAVYSMGGFARNGDMLQIPYIGAYVINDVNGATLEEINSVTMDALYAEDSDDITVAAPNGNLDDPKTGDTGIEDHEQIGRFCPLTAIPKSQTPPAFPHTVDPYAWASRLFDYFTVQAPHDDFLPNVDPDSYYRDSLGAGMQPSGVANTTGVTANLNEDGVPVQGKININTVDWKVLSMLPLVRATNGSVDIANTQKLAQAIVRYREQNGPFQSIFDLNKVEDTTSAATPLAGFQNGYGMMNFAYARTTDIDARQGDLTPNDTTAGNSYPLFNSTTGSPTDGVTSDFKEKFLALTRISNMITTRSDTFTCYAMIQGYRGTTLVAQRRASFIIDRSNIGFTLDATGSRQMVTSPNIYKVPSN